MGDFPEFAAERPPVVLIAGPTASGKTGLSIGIAKAIAARGASPVVINADSAQVYADLAVLSAHPTHEEMADIPHRLFGTWDGATACSAADWAAAAKREIQSAHGAGKVPILVGGTGFYMRTLLEGIAPIPEISPEVRAEVRAMPVDQAHDALIRGDPLRAATLSPGDTQRIARALEVLRSTGKPLAYWQARKTGGIGDAVTLHPLVLLPDRDWLYDRCNRRFELMLESGAIEEVQTLLKRNLPPDLPVMRAIGVPEIAALLSGDLSREDCVVRGAQATRNYAKRQYTWFRRQPPQEWPRLEVAPNPQAFVADLPL